MFFETFIFCNLAFLLGIRRNVLGNEEESVQSQVFVDKTLLVKEFFKTDSTHLVTVPQGFGKTTNMDMIRRFCEIQVDEHGDVIPRNETKYLKVFSSLYFKEGTSSFLDVYEDKVFFNRFFGQYPTIHMDFSLFGYESWKEFKNSLVKSISELFNLHKYLLGSNDLSDKEKVVFRNYQFQIICAELQNDQLAESVSCLASLLYKHFNKKIILLIDEIDSVLHHSIMKDCDNIQEIITLISDLISNALNSNFITKAILNSSSVLAKALIKNLNNIDHFMFYKKHPFNKFYGFTQKEVTYLAGIFDLKNNLTTIRDWYNGYKITKSDLKMYNFNSVTNVLFKKDLGIYSIKAKYPKRFERLLLNRNVRMKVKMLINDGEMIIRPVEEVLMRNILRLGQIFENKKFIKITPEDEFLVFDYMLNLGYFTVFNFNKDGSELSIKVPNVESRSELLDLVYSMPYFKKKLNLTDEEIFSVNETLLDSKMSKYLKEPVLTSSHYI